MRQPRRYQLIFVMVAALLIALCALACFGALTGLDHRLETPGVQHFDLSLQARVHALTSPMLTGLMLALTGIGSIEIFATALSCVLLFLSLRGRRHAAVLLGSTLLGAFALNETLKLHFHRARPIVSWSVGDEHTFSFPSGHSLFSFALYGMLTYLAVQPPTTIVRRLVVVVPAILLIVGIGMSRIYLGMHFPSDVLAGYLTGALWLSTMIAIDRVWRATLGVAAARARAPNPSA